MPKLYWELNWLNQWDPRLIKFIKEELLIPPPFPKQKLNLQNEFDMRKPWQHQGQNGEAIAVESLYGLNKANKNRSKFFIHIREKGGIPLYKLYFYEIRAFHK